MFISDPYLSEITGDRVSHAFWGLQGGVSHGVYHSLNCGLETGDDSEAVHENRARVAADMTVRQEQLLSLKQIHSNKCIYAGKPWPIGDRPEADAMVTNVPGLALGVLTADCAPVLFYGGDSNNKPVIGAVHAGWRGALGGVLENTVAQMKKLDVDPADITAVIGPCIGFQSYEVTPDFIEPFVEQDPYNRNFFTEGLNEGKFFFNMVAYMRERLELSNVGKMISKNIDTYFNEEDFFSYRRSTHREEPDCGRQISTIVINDI